MRITHTEIRCDNCGSFTIYDGWQVGKEVMADGWLISKGAHFCDYRCKVEHKAKNNK